MSDGAWPAATIVLTLAAEVRAAVLRGIRCSIGFKVQWIGRKPTHADERSVDQLLHELTDKLPKQKRTGSERRKTIIKQKGIQILFATRQCIQRAKNE